MSRRTSLDYESRFHLHFNCIKPIGEIIEGNKELHDLSPTLDAPPHYPVLQYIYHEHEKFTNSWKVHEHDENGLWGFGTHEIALWDRAGLIPHYHYRMNGVIVYHLHLGNQTRNRIFHLHDGLVGCSTSETGLYNYYGKRNKKLAQSNYHLIVAKHYHFSGLKPTDIILTQEDIDSPLAMFSIMNHMHSIEFYMSHEHEDEGLWGCGRTQSSLMQNSDFIHHYHKSNDILLQSICHIHFSSQKFHEHDDAVDYSVSGKFRKTVVEDNLTNARAQ